MRGGDEIAGDPAGIARSNRGDEPADDLRRSRHGRDPELTEEAADGASVVVMVAGGDQLRAGRSVVLSLGDGRCMGRVLGVVTDRMLMAAMHVQRISRSARQ